MRRVIPLLLFVCLAVSIAPTPIRAYIDCDPAAFLGSLSEFKSTGDAVKDLALITAIEKDLRALRAACAEYKWQGKGTVVTDVFKLPVGVFKAEFTSANSFVGDLAVIDGDCDMGYFSQLAPVDPDATMSRLIQSDGCTAVFEITVARAPWTITVTKLD